jgi:hypothetical protein
VGGSKPSRASTFVELPSNGLHVCGECGFPPQRGLMLTRVGGDGFEVVWGKGAPQVPPLRFASVGMTRPAITALVGFCR